MKYPLETGIMWEWDHIRRLTYPEYIYWMWNILPFGWSIISIPDSWLPYYYKSKYGHEPNSPNQSRSLIMFVHNGVKIEIIKSCPSDKTEGTRYLDGGYDVQHGLPEGSPFCLPNCPGRHYVSPNGEVLLSVWDRVY